MAMIQNPLIPTALKLASRVARLKKLRDLKAPDSIVKNEERMIGDALAEYEEIKASPQWEQWAKVCPVPFDEVGDTVGF
jgi:hypothetical protein